MYSFIIPMMIRLRKKKVCRTLNSINDNDFKIKKTSKKHLEFPNAGSINTNIMFLVELFSIQYLLID